MFRDKPLGVVGGGDSAMEEASYLAKFASTVHVFHRREAFRASKTMQERVLGADNIEVHWNKSVVDVLGDSMIEAVQLEDTVTGDHSQLELSGLFIAIGHTPASSFLVDSEIELDEKGYIVLNQRDSHTNIDGVFAAGDVADKVYRQAVTAAGMGCQAALDAERYLNES